MLLVEVNGLLNGLVADCIAVGEVLGDNTASRFLLLGNLVAVTLLIRSVVGSLLCACAGGTRNLNLSCTKSSVIKKQSSLCGSLFLKRDGCLLRFARGRDLDVCDLTTVDK